VSDPRVVNDLQPLTAADYEGVVEQYAEACHRLPGVRAIYRFGTIEAPGLSDLDLIVVLGEVPSDSRAALGMLSIAHERWRRDDVVARCFIHDVLVCSEEAFRGLAWLVTGDAPRFVAGSVIEREEFGPSTRAMVALVHGLDFCLERLHELTRLRARPQVSMRWLVPQLWSVTHTKRILEGAGVRLGETWEMLEQDLRALRATAVDRIDPTDVMEVWAETTRHFERAVVHFAERLVRCGALPSGGLARRCAAADARSAMLNVYDPAVGGTGPNGVVAELERRRIRLGRRCVESTWTRLTLPPAVFHHHIAYLGASSQHASLVQRLVGRASVAGALRTGEEYGNVVRRRLELIHRNDAVLDRYGVGFGRPRIPGVLGLGSGSPGGRSRGSWRFRVLKTLLDHRILPREAIVMGRARGGEK
jgi:hypothetical protein